MPVSGLGPIYCCNIASHNVATEDTGLAAELKRGLAFLRRDKEPNATKKQTDQSKKAKPR
jgi:hypothetical protein